MPGGVSEGKLRVKTALWGELWVNQPELLSLPVTLYFKTHLSPRPGFPKWLKKTKTK